MVSLMTGEDGFELPIYYVIGWCCCFCRGYQLFYVPIPMADDYHPWCDCQDQLPF